MAQKYWFTVHKRGYGWVPNTWQGWLIHFVFIAGLIYSFIEINNTSQSATETLVNFLPRVFIFSALLISIVYLKGEPWGKKKS
jgi:hypothetical protein